MWSGDGAQRPALAGALLALAAVLGLVETAILPPIPVPGVKLGLANVAILVSMVTLGRGWTLLVSMGRVVIVGMVTGTLFGPAGLLSVAGALAAWAVMAYLVSMSPHFSTIGVSVGGAAAHVAAQFGAAWVVMGVFFGTALLGLALAASAVSGLAIGVATSVLLSRLRVPLSLRRLRTAEVGVSGATAGR